MLLCFFLSDVSFWSSKKIWFLVAQIVSSWYFEESKVKKIILLAMAYGAYIDIVNYGVQVLLFIL